MALLLAAACHFGFMAFGFPWSLAIVYGRLR